MFGTEEPLTVFVCRSSIDVITEQNRLLGVLGSKSLCHQAHPCGHSMCKDMYVQLGIYVHVLNADVRDPCSSETVFFTGMSAK